MHILKGVVGKRGDGVGGGSKATNFQLGDE